MAKETSSKARCRLFPRIASPEAVLRAKRHVATSITTLRHQLGYLLIARLGQCPCCGRYWGPVGRAPAVVYPASSVGSSMLRATFCSAWLAFAWTRCVGLRYFLASNAYAVSANSYVFRSTARPPRWPVRLTCAHGAEEASARCHAGGSRSNSGVGSRRIMRERVCACSCGKVLDISSQAS